VNRPPRLDAAVMVCAGCWAWQCDITRRAVVEADDPADLVWAVADLSRRHIFGIEEEACPNGPGARVRLPGGQWVDAPTMEDGSPATGTMAVVPLPAWWVIR
jgi:hypothetical protein